jgi:magnesium transporter
MKQSITTNEKPKMVADLLVETTSWWIDVFAPSNDEMRAISKVKAHTLHCINKPWFLNAIL